MMYTNRILTLEHRQGNGFTIVELLIVIVVIGILAGIAIVSYSGIQSSAITSVLKNDLDSASRQLELSKVDNSDKYPETDGGLKPSGGVDFQYTYESYDNSYCLSATSSVISTLGFYTTNLGGITEGVCEGHNAPGSFANTLTLTQQATSLSVYWLSAAISSDGTKQIAGASGYNYLYTSADSGITWIQRTTSADGYNIWGSVASSADGTKLVAAGPDGGSLHTSTDSGANWTERSSAGNREWTDLASSADGTKLVAAVSYGGSIYTSADSGSTWTQRTDAGARNWAAIDSSSDGTRLSAIVSNGYIYTSTDSGANWTERTSAGSRSWTDLASSADGMKLSATTQSGSIFTSTNAGTDWTEHVVDGVSSWAGIASSDDGSRLVAGATNLYGSWWAIYTSTDSGSSWKKQISASSVTGLYVGKIAISGNGTKVIIPSQSYLYIGQLAL